MRLTRRISHFSSSVTHCVLPGAVSTRNSSSGWRMTLSASAVSIKRVETAGRQAARREACENFIVSVNAIIETMNGKQIDEMMFGRGYEEGEDARNCLER